MAPKDDDDSSSDTESPRQQAANDARQNFLQDMNRIFEQILADKTNIKQLTLPEHRFMVENAGKRRSRSRQEPFQA